MGRIYGKNLGGKTWVKKVQIHHHQLVCHLSEEELSAMKVLMLINVHQQIYGHHHHHRHRGEEIMANREFKDTMTAEIEVHISFILSLF